MATHKKTETAMEAGIPRTDEQQAEHARREKAAAAANKSESGTSPTPAIVQGPEAAAPGAASEPDSAPPIPAPAEKPRKAKGKGGSGARG